MGILFGLLVLALLILGWQSRKKQKKEWLKEERHDESGAWLDKRAGERGTYGTLDAEMEQSRQSVSKQNKINELARLVRTYFFEQHPDFHTLSDEQIKKHIAFCKSQIAGFVGTIEKMPNDFDSDLPESSPQPDLHILALKKQILAFSFDNFSKLLDLEIEVMKQFDRLAEHLATNLLDEIERLKK